MDVIFELTRVVVSAVSKRCASAILEVARQNPRYSGKLIEMGQATNRAYVHLKYFSGRVLMPPGTPQYLRSNTGGQQLQQVQCHHHVVQDEMQQVLQQQGVSTAGGGGGLATAAGAIEKRDAAVDKSSPSSFFLPFPKAATVAAPDSPPRGAATAAGAAAAGVAALRAAEEAEAGGAGAGTAGGAAAGTARDAAAGTARDAAAGTAKDSAARTAEDSAAGTAGDGAVGTAGDAAAGTTGDAGAAAAKRAAAGAAEGAAAGESEGAATGAADGVAAGAAETIAGKGGGEKAPAPPPASLCSVLEGSSRMVGNSNSVDVCPAGASGSNACSGSPNTCTFARSNSGSSLPFGRSSTTTQQQQQHVGSNTGGQRPPQAKITLTVKPLDEDKALEVGAEALSDGLVMIVMLCLVAVGLYIRRLYAARSEARVRLREEQLRLQYEATQEQLDRIVAFLQQQFPHACNQSALRAPSRDAAEAAALAATTATHREAPTKTPTMAITIKEGALCPSRRGEGSPATRSESATSTSEGNTPRRRDAATENETAAGGSAGIRGRAPARPTQ